MLRRTTILPALAVTLALFSPACAVDVAMSDDDVDEAASAYAPAYAFTRTGPVGWAACGSEGGSCQMPPSTRAVVRYGSPGKYFYYATDGITSAPCSNYNGDPSVNVGKQCHYTTNLTIAQSFTRCSGEGGACDVGGAPVWVRYGVPGRWYETVQTGYVPCNNDYFHYDPAPNQFKFCEVGAPLKTDDTGFQTCAAEGQTCSLPSTIDGVLMRYGADTRWRYRIADTTSIGCSNDIFNDDPAEGTYKFCQYAVLPAKAGTTGAWTQAASCAGCGYLNQAVTWGTQRTDTTTITQQWTQTVTTSMEAGFSIEGITGKVSSSVANSYAHGTAFATALTTSYGQTVTANCQATAPGESLAIYQFSTTTDAECVRESGCVGHTYTNSFVCVHNPPVGYTGPRCAPNDCADLNCTTCLSGP